MKTSSGEIFDASIVKQTTIISIVSSRKSYIRDSYHSCSAAQHRRSNATPLFWVRDVQMQTGIILNIIMISILCTIGDSGSCLVLLRSE